MDKEALKNLYQRVVQVAIAKFNDGEPDDIKLRDDGNFTLVWGKQSRGEYYEDTAEVLAEELTSDLDAMVKERLEKEELNRKVALEKLQDEQKQRDKRKEEEEFALFQILKKKFETKE